MASRVGRAERDRRLAAVADRSRGRVHRAAVLAGAPSRLPALRSYRPGRRREAAALSRRLAFTSAKIAGARTVQFDHPGAAGHERCRDICVTYS